MATPQQSCGMALGYLVNLCRAIRNEQRDTAKKGETCRTRRHIDVCTRTLWESRVRAKNGTPRNMIGSKRVIMSWTVLPVPQLFSFATAAVYDNELPERGSKCTQVSSG